jgi:hypothetical protein
VHHEHVASLGTIEVPLSVAARIAFWEALHERLRKLGNRVDAETQAKVLGAVHARIPMVTADEQAALQIENAETMFDFGRTLATCTRNKSKAKSGLRRTRTSICPPMDEAAARASR